MSINSLTREEYSFKISKRGYDFIIDYINNAKVDKSYEQRVRGLSNQFHHLSFTHRSSFVRSIQDGKKHIINERYQVFKRLDKIKLLGAMGIEDFIDIFNSYIMVHLIEIGKSRYPDYLIRILNDIEGLILINDINGIISNDYHFLTNLEELHMDMIDYLEWNSSFLGDTDYFHTETGELLDYKKAQCLDNKDPDKVVSMYKLNEDTIELILDTAGQYLEMIDDHPLSHIIKRLEKFYLDANKEKDIFRIESMKVDLFWDRANIRLLWDYLYYLIGFYNPDSEFHKIENDESSLNYIREHMFYTVKGKPFSDIDQMLYYILVERIYEEEWDKINLKLELN